ncbi:hypothetical protein GX48_02008 [Paracoccidioides brasiliensis]|nr:hypothetical protein GX48_02008 [Paracoccidioides brasiliensis]
MIRGYGTYRPAARAGLHGFASIQEGPAQTCIPGAPPVERNCGAAMPAGLLMGRIISVTLGIWTRGSAKIMPRRRDQPVEYEEQDEEPGREPWASRQEGPLLAGQVKRGSDVPLFTIQSPNVPRTLTTSHNAYPVNDHAERTRYHDVVESTRGLSLSTHDTRQARSCSRESNRMSQQKLYNLDPENPHQNVSYHLSSTPHNPLLQAASPAIVFHQHSLACLTQITILRVIITPGRNIQMHTSQVHMYQIGVRHITTRLLTDPHSRDMAETLLPVGAERKKILTPDGKSDQPTRECVVGREYAMTTVQTILKVRSAKFSKASA